jgi:small GTP-binding protein
LVIFSCSTAAVGKSALLTRFSDNAFLPHYSSTIGIDFSSRMIRVDKAICKLEIWDTAGQERFSTITANYYRGAQGALLVYDVTERGSFDRVHAWFDRARQLGGEDVEMILVGNKIDLPDSQRQVSTEEGTALAAQLGISFAETSALNGSNVECAFVTMTRHIKSSLDRRGLTGIKSGALSQAGGVQLAYKESPANVCGCL